MINEQVVILLMTYDRLGYALSKSMEDAKTQAEAFVPADMVEFICAFDELCVYRAGI